MAIKESRAEDGQWCDPLWWRDRLPLEIRIHQLIDQNRPKEGGRGHESLLEHRGYRPMTRQRRFRLYMRYYEGGNLREAVEDNFELREQNPNSEKFAGYSTDDIVHLDDNGDPPLILPDGFIWWIFRRLIDACQVFHSRQALEVDGAKVDWKPITHLDIRMDNIYLQPRAFRQDDIRPVHIAAQHVLCSFITQSLITIVSPNCLSRLRHGNLRDLGRVPRKPGRIHISRTRC